MRHAVLIAGHGSRDADGIAEFLGMARLLRDRQPELPTEAGFLEFARPTIQEGIDKLAHAGATTIVVVPGVLVAAGHAKNDMACEIQKARQRHPGIAIHMGAALGIGHRLLELCRLRYHEALANSAVVPAEETLLLLVGRGSSDPDANADIAKAAWFLKQGYPTGWAACAYSGIAQPLLEEALSVCERAGFRRIVVQPYFLFTGVLLKRIYTQVAERQQARPDLDIVATPHLQAHPLLLDTFAERCTEALHGTGHMNCSLCQYRVPIIGHEQRVGAPQEPHHHHVQGLFSHVHHIDESAIGGRKPHEHGHHHHEHELAAAGAFADGSHPWANDLLDRLHF